MGKLELQVLDGGKSDGARPIRYSAGASMSSTFGELQITQINTDRKINVPGLREYIIRDNVTIDPKSKGDALMEDGYKTLIERLDQDIRDHKQEIRDRDTRLQTEMQEREERYRDESKEREQRIENLINSLREDIKGSFHSFDSKLDKMETNFDSKLTEVKSKVDSTYRHITGITIATIIGIAAMVVTVIVAVS